MLLWTFCYVSTALPEHVFLLGMYFGAELLGYKHALCLILKNNAKLFSKMIIHVHCAPAIYTSSPCTFTNSSHQLLVLSEFVLLASGGSVVVAHCGSFSWLLRRLNTFHVVGHLDFLDVKWRAYSSLLFYWAIFSLFIYSRFFFCIFWI